MVEEKQEEVTFRVYSIDKLNMKKYKDMKLNIKSIKYVFCSGTGCTVYYKNGRDKHILWEDYNVLDMLSKDDNDTSKYLWFDNETYDLFLNWKNQFPFEELYFEDKK